MKGKLREAFTKKYFIILSILLVMAVMQLGGIYQLLEEPNKALSYELGRKESYISNKRVEFLIWRGADPTYVDKDLDPTGDPRSFTLMMAIRNGRVEILPLLKADYSEEQKAIALESTKDDKILQDVLVRLFEEK
ncbi:hypothetical protein [Pleionea sp. CnH1-48]|uniref:hypothetical protein n=1 Tax=Pleionea sp. CnH1-48 TaxID=2954494 RepID=UPI002097907F|nr:hypothetical protein [Pleionea sp. CnH1-48]MCO7226587.1 hypothetical protein [Pleionea sp. CnH1-48]